MKILIVDDDSEHREYLAAVVKEWKYEVEQAQDGEEALALLSEQTVDIILTDLMMPRMDGFALLRNLGAQGAMPPTILMTAFGSLEKALHTIHELDGFWFLEKPIDLTALELLLKRAGSQRRLTIENEELRRQLSYTGILSDLVGQAPAMQEVFALIRQVAPTSAAVMVTGESGTGKELVARALHANSRRSAGPFIAINCAALPESLIESEIFGHEKGAFTGAVERRLGAMELAQGGTLFLDELGEMPLPMQAKLLRVLEDLRFRRLGGKQELQADIRIVAATNRDPMQSVADGVLREDLFYRLNVFQIHLPPLRERKEDIPRIVEAMIQSMNQKHGTKVLGALPAFYEVLQHHDWPGNVRELRNIVERAVIVAGSEMLKPSHASLMLNHRSAVASVASTWDSSAVAHAHHATGHGGPAGLAFPSRQVGGATLSAAPEVGYLHEKISDGVAVGMTIDDAERWLIEATLLRAGNNKTKAASILGISTKTLHVKLRQYRIDESAHDEQDNG